MIISVLVLYAGITAFTESVKKIIEPETADYSPLSDQTDLYLDAAKHAARLKTDEDGIEAAAYTVLITNETAVFIDEPIEFTADRPFFFSLQAADGSPLFEGVVNTPK